MAGMTMSTPVRLVTLLVLAGAGLLAVGSQAHAQFVPGNSVGWWSLSGNCAGHHYAAWMMPENTIRFADENNTSYDERIVAVRSDGFTTFDTVLKSGSAGAWNYTFVDNDTLRVENLATRRVFTEHRCVPLAPAAEIPIQDRAQGRWPPVGPWRVLAAE